jgi:hypothetical protein
MSNSEKNEISNKESQIKINNSNSIIQNGVTNLRRDYHGNLILKTNRGKHRITFIDSVDRTKQLAEITLVESFKKNAENDEKVENWECTIF